MDWDDYYKVVDTVTCPVCGGSGTVPGDTNPVPWTYRDTVEPGSIPCSNCSGRGKVNA